MSLRTPVRYRTGRTRAGGRSVRDERVCFGIDALTEVVEVPEGLVVVGEETDAHPHLADDASEVLVDAHRAVAVKAEHEDRRLVDLRQRRPQLLLGVGPAREQ